MQNKLPDSWQVLAGANKQFPYHEATRFCWDGKVYVLRSPVAYTVTYEGVWVYRCNRYGLHAFATDKATAFAEFNEEFAFIYEGLVNEPDENLTQDAITLKHRLIEDVELPH